MNILTACCIKIDAFKDDFRLLGSELGAVLMIFDTFDPD